MSPQKLIHSAHDSGDENETNEGNVDGEDQNDKKKLFAKAIIGEKFDWEITEVVGPEILRASSFKRMCFPDHEMGISVPSDKQVVVFIQS